MKVCLLVDDDKDDQYFFAEALSEIGEAKLLLASDAGSATKILREEPAPDLIFLDLVMPGESGIDLLLQIKRDINHRKIPVIIYSQLDDPREITKAKKMGASDFIVKPDAPEELQRVLRSFL